ncbi:site-specific DNA-methyltransferase [Chryseobacterium sp. SIMBA_029]|uniref:site-specific DNA-methyltransferase n=3 Tax=Bacteria TaxID=2 RepID=UPI00397B04C3
MSNYENLQKVLREIFEMDKADLDFGIYRIMNQKRDQVNEFIDKKLPKDIKDTLGQIQSKDSITLQAELDKMGKGLDDAGVVREDSPKYMALQQQITSAIDTNALEQEVFSHLANFFKRYYKDGDFISLRRYKKDVYAIPYEGEEVKLHWANADQYYIKTSEHLKNYAFKLNDGKKVYFQLKEASTEQNNNKTQGDVERRFAIFEELPVEVIEDELYINFTYETHKKTVKQDELSKQAFEVIQENIPSSFTLAFDKAPTEKNKNRTLLEKHLNDFISRNSFDYFIHKDLGRFLKRELDFYIKNEVLFIDDINTENPIYFTAQLSKIKALKTVASKIIAFLAQIEDFQKKLWLKKKFVISTNYCITLDRIPEKYYEEISANEAQLAEWGTLYDVTLSGVNTLSQEKFLVLDTKFFSEEFKDKLLAEFDNLDEETDGLLINSENFQALNAIQEKFKEKVQTIYIDPPFNTGHDFLYKDVFRDSSWMSLIYDRVLLSHSFLKNDGSFYLHLDNNANYFGRFILDNIFEESRFLNEITWQRTTSVGSSKAIANRFPTVSDTIFLYVKNKNTYKFNKFYTPPSEDYKARFKEEDKNGKYYWNTLAAFSKETYSRLEKEDKVRWTEGAKYPQYKTYLHELKGNVIPDVWTDINMLNPMAAERALVDFPTQKPELLINRVLESTSDKSDLILDYFNGSGTTSATALKMKRKFIGVEMGSYFNSKLLPRIKKVLHGDKNGVSKENNWNGGGLVKYQVLESYEDALNNLQLGKSSQDGLFQFSETAQEDYLLHYMLDVETQDHLFNIEMFRNPFNYQLKVTENNELVPTKVDLVETFNYLIGMYVSRVQRIKDIKLIEGKTREGIKTLIIWRNLENTTHDEVAKVFRKLYDGVRSSEFDQIYINGDHHFDNIRTGGDNFKVKMIEETFFKKMFNISEL